MLLEAVKKELETDIFHFYVGTSYRHCLIWENGEVVDLVQPHDVLGPVSYTHLDVYKRQDHESVAVLCGGDPEKQRSCQLR